MDVGTEWTLGALGLTEGRGGEDEASAGHIQEHSTWLKSSAKAMQPHAADLMIQNVSLGAIVDQNRSNPLQNTQQLP